MSRTNWLMWMAAAAATSATAALTLPSCTQVDCGTGTANKNGQCVPTNDTTGDAKCGDGTHLGTSGQCEPDFAPTQCDPSTTQAMTDPKTGVITCVGTGGPGGCSAPLACGNPTGSSKMTICGQIKDLQDDSKVAAAGATGTQCDPQNPTPTGPCSLRIRAYDAIAFTSQGTSAPTLPSDPIYIDDCGRYRIPNVDVTGVQFVGLGVDNATKVTTPLYRTTGVALPIAKAKAVPGFDTYAMKISTDNAWTTSANIGGGMSFVDRGLYVGIFRHQGQPVSGVKIMLNGGVDAMARYFTDTTPTSRTTVGATSVTMTGANGTGLSFNDNGSLVNYTGTGGETTNCSWPSNLGDQITNIAFVQLRDEVLTSNPTMACP